MRKKEVNERKCFNCSKEVENEHHIILKCPLYVDLRQSMFTEVSQLNNIFLELSDENKFIFLFSNDKIFKSVAKTCHNILLRRNIIFYH